MQEGTPWGKSILEQGGLSTTRGGWLSLGTEDRLSLHTGREVSVAEDVEGPRGGLGEPGGALDGPGAVPDRPGAVLDGSGERGEDTLPGEELPMGSTVVEQTRTCASKGRLAEYSLLQVGQTSFSAHSCSECTYSVFFALNRLPHPLLHVKGKISGSLKVLS